ncbi:hypothetical protein PV783_18775 [Chitinophaga sp. CC14]|uniref:hypothetical protein n=2 Tax=Chitinophagaceae TaxID=563835 RepID=UPI000DB95D4F
MKTKLFYTALLLLYNILVCAQTDKSYTALQKHFSMKKGEDVNDIWEYYLLDFKKDQVGILRYGIYSQQQGGNYYYTLASVDDEWTYHKWQQQNGIIQIDYLPEEDVAKKLKIAGDSLVSVNDNQIVFRERKNPQPADTVVGKTYVTHSANNYLAFSFDKDSVEIAHWKDIGDKEKVFVYDETEKPRKYKWLADGDYILMLGFEPINVAIFKNNTVIGFYFRKGRRIPMTLETRKPGKNVQ